MTEEGLIENGFSEDRFSDSTLDTNISSQACYLRQKLRSLCRLSAMDLLARREHGIVEIERKLKTKKSKLLTRLFRSLEKDPVWVSAATHWGPASNDVVDEGTVSSEGAMEAMSNRESYSKNKCAELDYRKFPHQPSHGKQSATVLNDAILQAHDHSLNLSDYANECFDTELDHALQGLQNDGLLSDSRFAEAYARSRVNAGFGPERIQQELYQKGVMDTAWLATFENWDEQIERVIAKKYKHAKFDASDRRALQGLDRFLRYRGFSPGSISQALRELDLP